MVSHLREDDVVVVWKLDRLSRSLKDLLHIMEKTEIAGAGSHSLTEAIDTPAAAGRMMMQMVGSFAGFERAMIRERKSAGLAQARAKGGSAGQVKALPFAISLPNRGHARLARVKKVFVKRIKMPAPTSLPLNDREISLGTAKVQGAQCTFGKHLPQHS